VSSRSCSAKSRHWNAAANTAGFLSMRISEYEGAQRQTCAVAEFLTAVGPVLSLDRESQQREPLTARTLPAVRPTPPRAAS
jgi:hypothetical protein